MTNQTFLDSLLDIKGAAKFLGVSVSFIRKVTLNGQLAHFKVGSRFYFKEDDLLNLIKRNEPQINDKEPSLE